MVEQEDIYRIKESVDLVTLVRSRGIAFTKNDKDYKGICPFHGDKDPSFSVNPEKNLWHCFGCDKGGDAIRFVELIDGVDFKEAVRRLMVPESRSTQTTGINQRTEDRKAVKEEKKITVADKELLARVAGYYHHTFSEDLRGLDYLKGRGITNNQSFTDFGTGFVNGSLKNILPYKYRDISHLFLFRSRSDKIDGVLINSPNCRRRTQTRSRLRPSTSAVVSRLAPVSAGSKTAWPLFTTT